MSASEYASEIYAFSLDTWLSTSVIVLTIYEYVITFDVEVTHIWRRKKTVPTILLLVMRWAMVLQSIASMLKAGTSQGCEAEAIIENFFLALTSALIAGLSGLRVYAVSGCNRALFIIVFLLGFPAVVANLYALNGVYQPDPIFGCIEDSKYSTKTEIALVRAVRIPAILGDALVVGVTWTRSYQQLREGRRHGMSLPLSTLLLRDGTIYFLILLVMSVVELCPNLPEAGESISYITPYLPPILLNRFMFGLKQLSEDDAASESRLHTISTPMFKASIDVTGNMGESLEFSGDTEADLDL